MKRWTKSPDSGIRARNEGTDTGSREGYLPGRIYSVTLLLLGVLTGCQELAKIELPSWLSTSDQEAQVSAQLPAAKAAAPGQGTEAAIAPPADRGTVREIQSKLSKLGYDPGSADGFAGPKTAQAIRRYRIDHNLPVNGEASPMLLGLLDRTIDRRQALLDTVPAGQKAQKRKQASNRKTGKKTTKSAKKPASGLSLRRSDLPNPSEGSTFVYSDGTVETIAGVKGSMLRWRRGDGTVFTADRNFLLPWSTWTGDGERGTATVSRSPDRLWPMMAGRDVSFSAKVVVQKSEADAELDKWTEQWRCRLSERKMVTVPAGAFDTVRFECERAAGHAAPPLTRIWYYAPAIGHYVRREEISMTTGTALRTDLVAIRPGGGAWPPFARAALDRAVHEALESGRDGRNKSWSSSGLNTKVTIRPATPFEGGDGRRCRTFVQTWSDPTGVRRFPAAACRNEAGEWRIPGLDEGPDASLAVSGDRSKQS